MAIDYNIDALVRARLAETEPSATLGAYKIAVLQSSDNTWTYFVCDADTLRTKQGGFETRQSAAEPGARQLARVVASDRVEANPFGHLNEEEILAELLEQLERE